MREAGPTGIGSRALNSYGWSCYAGAIADCGIDGGVVGGGVREKEYACDAFAGYGFSALSGGGRYFGETFDGAGNGGHWRTAAEHSDGYAHGRNISNNGDNVNEINYDKSIGFSVRCVKEW